jgi:hypothetical protein
LATILRVRGLRVVIYLNDHPPPHVHVIGRDGEAKIALGQKGSRVAIVSNDGLSPALLAAALAEIDRNEALLAQRWREIHGDS